MSPSIAGRTRMNTIEEILAWFASHGMSGGQRLEFRSGQPAAFVGRRSSSGEIAVFENTVFVFRASYGGWRVDRYFFGGRSEGADFQTADEGPHNQGEARP